jgi:hypothetical protein
VMMILLRIETKLREPTTKRVPMNGRRANWDDMRDEMGKDDWRQDLRGERADEMWESLRKIHETIETNVP